MRTLKFRNSTNYNYETMTGGEKNYLPSVTVPDMSLTIPEILDRYTRGLPLSLNPLPAVGYDDPDFDDVDPTRDPAFDLNDAKRLSYELEQKKQSQKQQKEPTQKTIDDAIAEARGTE